MGDWQQQENPKTHLPLGRSPPLLGPCCFWPLCGGSTLLWGRADGARCLWDPRFWRCSGLHSDVQCGEGIKQHVWSCRGLGLRCRQLNPAPRLLQGAAGTGLGAFLGCPAVVPAPWGWALPEQRWGQGQHGCSSAGLRLGCCLACPGFCLCASLTCLGKAATRKYFAAGSIRAAPIASVVLETVK